MQERLPEILAFAEEARGVFDAAVLLGMGGSSLAPEVFRRVSEAESLHVLDTTHPASVRRLAESLDTERTLLLVSSKSGRASFRRWRTTRTVPTGRRRTSAWSTASAPSSAGGRSPSPRRAVSSASEAKDRTLDVLSGHGRGLTPDMSAGDMGAVENLLAGARPPEDVAIQAFIDPAREGELAPLVKRARATGCAVTVGLGPRYLHSTGQLHKGGPPTGRFVQVVDDPGDELPIPSREFGFRRLIHAQAEGDLAALPERARPVVRVRLEDL